MLRSFVDLNSISSRISVNLIFCPDMAVDRSMVDFFLRGSKAFPDIFRSYTNTYTKRPEAAPAREIEKAKVNYGINIHERVQIDYRLYLQSFHRAWEIRFAGRSKEDRMAGWVLYSNNVLLHQSVFVKMGWR